MAYTVNQLAKIAGVSVRTLHHYDEIGLLKPSYIKENGYRYYEGKELITLQQILFYKELDFPLEQIKRIMQSPSFNTLEAMHDQKKMLEKEKKRIEGLLKTITSSITSMQNNTKQKDEELYTGLTKEELDAYREEAREKWGHSDAYQESIKRYKSWSPERKKQIFEEQSATFQRIAALMDRSETDEEVQKEIHNVFLGMQHFYDCSYEIFRGLGRMYVDDKRFTATFDKIKPGLAEFLCKAMTYYSDKHEK